MIPISIPLCFLLLELLRSKLYLLGVPFFMRFLRIWPFFSQTIEVVCLHRWCMLGVILWLAFTRLGHECQDLLSPVWWNASVQRLDLSLYSHPKSFGEMGVRIHAKSKGKIPSARGSEEGWTCDAASRRTVSPTLYRQLFEPLIPLCNCWVSFSAESRKIILHPQVTKAAWLLQQE